MLYYRFHGFPVAADAPLGETFALVKECLEKAGLKNRPLRFCLFGTQGCQQIVASFPEFRRFLSTAGAEPHAEPIQHLSNFGPSAPGHISPGECMAMICRSVALRIEGECEAMIRGPSRFAPG